MSRYHCAWQQLQHSESTEPPLNRHQQNAGRGERRQPGGQLTPLPPAHRCEHQQAHPDHKGIEAVKPFQKNLQVHLAARQQRAVTEWPVRAGKAGLHHAGGATDPHQGDQRHQQMGGKGGQPGAQSRGGARFADGRDMARSDCSEGFSLQWWGRHHSPLSAMDVTLTTAINHA